MGKVTFSNGVFYTGLRNIILSTKVLGECSGRLVFLFEAWGTTLWMQSKAKERRGPLYEYESALLLAVFTKQRDWDEMLA